jgi:hypothetical protein
MAQWKRHSAAAALTLALLAGAATASADTVLQWNATAVTMTNSLGAFRQARWVAMSQLAVFEAVNAIAGSPYQPYLGTIVAPVGASPEAAAAQAAHDVLVVAAPGSIGALDALLATSLDAIPDGPGKAGGVATGAAAAAAILAARANDGSSPVLTFPPNPPTAGEWQATTPGCNATAGSGAFFNWRDVTPFGIGAALDFLPAPPPSLRSTLYAKDYLEVKTVGATVSAERPADRSTVASFYASASPSFVFSSVATQLATANGDTPVQNARALALINMSISDSLVASFAAKYTYNFWRPETAIREGASDDNSKTNADVTFTPFITTPCFPSYPSNHASGSGGGAEAVRRLYGAAGHSITLVHPVSGVVLTYSSLEQITDDVDDARVFGGIHFRFDQVAGSRLGRGVATEVVKNNLNAIHP